MAPRAAAKDKATETAPAAPGRIVGKVGNLTKDPELRFSEGGRAYCRTGLAVNMPVTPGDWSDTTTEFYDVTCFGDLAENVAATLTKGTRVVVVGRGEKEEWVGKDGEARITKKILADGLGPDLRWATAEVTKIGRTGPTAAQPVADDDDSF